MLRWGFFLSLRIDELWPLGQGSDVPLRDLFDVQFVVPHCSCLTHTMYVLRWGTFSESCDTANRWFLSKECAVSMRLL